MEKTEFLNTEERDAIAAAVAHAETTTAGEIRVVVVKDSKSFKGENPVYLHAVKAFNKYGLHNTINKTGVLIFLSIEKRRIEILADEGINAKVDQHIWDDMTLTLASKIRAGHACDGICDLVRQVGELLTTHFLIQPGDENELSNEVVVEE